MRWQLVGLVLLAVLPALGLLVTVGAERRREALAVAGEYALRVARSAAEGERRLVEDVELRLGTLTGVPAVQDFDLEATRELFVSVLDRDSTYANLVSVRQDGSIAAMARPGAPPRDARDREEIRRALDEGRFAAGGYRVGRVTRVSSVGFAMPMLEPDGKVRGAVQASIDVARLGRLLTAETLPEGSVRFILDQHGAIVFREPGTGEWLGRRPGESLVDSMLAGVERTTEGRGLDGVDRIYGTVPVTAGGLPWMTVGVGIPRDVVLAPARRALMRDLAAMILVAALALIAAWIGVEALVLRRTRALVRATQRVSEGDFHAATDTPGGGELGDLERSFAGMAQALAARSEERDEVEQAVRRAEEHMTLFARSLEQRVAERTHELADANRELATEIRQRQQAEAKIRGSQQELREFIDRMSALTAKVAPDGQLTLVNRAGEESAGLTLETLLDMRFVDAPWWNLDAEVKTRVRDAFQRALAGETVRWDERISDRGRERVIDLGLAPVRDEDGRIEYVVVEGRDITEQKEAERALQQRTAELEALNKELEAFSYSVSHDLKAPLRAIDGFSRIVLEDQADRLPPEAVAQLRRISDNAQQMATLIDDLLSFSRFSRQPLELRSVAPAPIVREVLAELREDNGRAVDIRVGALPNAQADPALLKQVYVNLLSNALKYTRHRDVTVIDVGARPAEGPHGESVYFVRDNGVGFDMRYADKLFGVFQRLHRPEEFEGTGVGLAIAQRIVFRHGGRIWAESEPGRGATFYFTLGTRS